MDYDSKTTFQYSSTAVATGEAIVVALASANNTATRSVNITDLKVTAVAASSTFEVLGQGTDGAKNGQSLSFYVGTASVLDFSWEVPYRVVAIASTGVKRMVVASATGAGVKYSVSGYLE